MAYRKPNTKLRMIQKFIRNEREESANPEIKDVMDCIQAIIEDRYTIRKVTEEKLIDLDTMEPVERHQGARAISSSIQTTYENIPQFGGVPKR